MSAAGTEAPDLDLLASDVENDLRATVRGLLAERCPSAAVAELYDGDRSLVDPLWRSIAVDLGIAGLLVPEDLGGAGASAREAAVVLEELGRACAPVPFLTSSVIATLVLLAGAEHTPCAELLGQLASGERTAALVVPFSTAPDAALPALSVDGAGGEVWGQVRSVAGALEADALLIPVAIDTGVEVRVVEAGAAMIVPVVSLDMTRQVADVRFDATPSTVLFGDAESAVRHALLVGAGLLASEQVGVARWCLEETVAYLKVRRQFGRIVGGFQAIKHRLADVFANVESAAAAARYAAAAVAEGDDVPIASRVAAAYASETAVHAAEEAVQLHGGIGMTWEHAAHLYLKRAKADQIGLGTAGAHRVALAPLIDVSL